MPTTLVVGATGGVGREVVAGLVEAGDSDVRILVRDRAKALAILETLPGVRRARSNSDVGITLVEGDVTDRDAVAAAVAGVKLVVMAHSRRFGDPAGGTAETVDFGGVVNVVAAAKAAGTVERLVYVSSNSVDRPGKLIVMILNWLGGMGLGWKCEAERVIRSSGIPYVIVRPTGLTDTCEPGIAVLQTEFDGAGWRISRLGVARLCVSALSCPCGAGLTVHCAGVSTSTPTASDHRADHDLPAALAGLIPDRPAPLAPGVEEQRQSSSPSHGDPDVRSSLAEHLAATERFALRVRLAGVGVMVLAAAGGICAARHHRL